MHHSFSLNPSSLTWGSIKPTFPRILCGPLTPFSFCIRVSTSFSAVPSCDEGLGFSGSQKNPHPSFQKAPPNFVKHDWADDAEGDPEGPQWMGHPDRHHASVSRHDTVGVPRWGFPPPTWLRPRRPLALKKIKNHSLGAHGTLNQRRIVHRNHSDC